MWTPEPTVGVPTRRKPMPHFHPLFTSMWRVALTLAIATIGALVLKSLSAPVPFLLGAFLFSMLGALLRLPVLLPGWFRLFAVPAIGVMLGSYFTPDLLGHAIYWWDGLLAVFLLVGIAFFTGPRLYRKLSGVDPMTALLASTPGGAAEMTAMAEHYNADLRVVALSQTIRVATTATCISAGLWLTGHAGLSLPARIGSGIGPFDWVVLMACAAVGCVVAIRLRIPAGAMLGPVVLSAAAHFSGLTDATPPALVVNVAQVVLGASLGVHFRQIRDIRAGWVVLASVSTTLLLLACAAAIAGVFQLFGWRDFGPVFLGIAPGGLSEMAVITVSLGIEVAFVTTCHLARLFVIIGIAPVVAARSHRSDSRTQLL